MFLTFHSVTGTEETITVPVKKKVRTLTLVGGKSNTLEVALSGVENVSIHVSGQGFSPSLSRCRRRKKGQPPSLTIRMAVSFDTH